MKELLFTHDSMTKRGEKDQSMARHAWLHQHGTWQDRCYRCFHCGESPQNNDSYHDMDECMLQCHCCGIIGMAHRGCEMAWRAQQREGETRGRETNDDVARLALEEEDNGDGWFCSEVCRSICKYLERSPIQKMCLQGLSEYHVELVTFTPEHRRSVRIVDSVVQMFHGLFQSEPGRDGFDVIDLVCKSNAEKEQKNCIGKFHTDGGIYSGFKVVVLRKGSSIVSAATFRCHGPYFAEVPFVATKQGYRREGNCRLLMQSLEYLLIKLGVSMVLLYSVPETLGIWENKMGFQKADLSIYQGVQQQLVSPEGTTPLFKSLGSENHTNEFNFWNSSIRSYVHGPNHAVKGKTTTGKLQRKNVTIKHRQIIQNTCFKKENELESEKSGNTALGSWHSQNECWNRNILKTQDKKNPCIETAGQQNAANMAVKFQNDRSIKLKTIHQSVYENHACAKSEALGTIQHHSQVWSGLRRKRRMNLFCNSSAKRRIESIEECNQGTKIFKLFHKEYNNRCHTPIKYYSRDFEEGTDDNFSSPEAFHACFDGMHV